MDDTKPFQITNSALILEDLPDDTTMRKVVSTPILTGREFEEAVSGPTGQAVEESFVADFQQVYRRAGVQEKRWDVYKVAAYLEEPELADLDQETRAAMTRLLLKSHDTQWEDIVEDGALRCRVLDQQAQALQTKVEQIRMQLEEENERLQAEIEHFANPRLEKMEANQARVEEVQTRLNTWLSQKELEKARVENVVALMPSDPVHETQPMGTPSPAFALHTSEEAPYSAQAKEPAPAAAEEPRQADEAVQAKEQEKPSRRTERLPAEITADDMAAIKGSGPKVYLALWVILALILVPLAWICVALPMKNAGLLGASLFGFFPILIALSAGFFGRQYLLPAICGVCMAAVVLLHVTAPQRLADSLAERPVWLIESAGIGQSFDPYLERYGELLVHWGLATQPVVEPSASLEHRE